MKIVLIYDSGQEYRQDLTVKEFEDEKAMIDFVNTENIGDDIDSCYEVSKEIEIVPFVKVTEYRVGK